MMNHSLAARTIVLLGIGHTNAHILRKWCMSPLPDTRLVCVSNFPVSTYSGMLPGMLAGDYKPQQMTIDLVRLCSAAGALLVLDDVVGLDHDEQSLLFRSRPPIPFDALSIGIGSVPAIQARVDDDAPLVTIKPMQTFVDRLSTQLRSSLNKPDRRSLRVAIVGGGVAGIEVAMCLPQFLRTVIDEHTDEDDVELSMMLIQRSDEVLPNRSQGLRRRVLKKLTSQGVAVHTGRAVEQVKRNCLLLSDGTVLPGDLVVWATGATAPELLGALGLPRDERGFLLTDRTLKTTADLPIFAVGDSGTVANEPLPKAGVYAVRQGPVLWTNLGRILDGRPLEQYRPQRRFLKLLNCGDRTALGEYGPISFGGSWVWRLKDRIDTRFVEKFQNLPQMSGDDETSMRCHGCGSKVASDDLFKVLGEIGHADDMPVGLMDYDDAAVVCVRKNQQVVLTTDFFPIPLEDAYLSGRIAALHAMSDVFAMGAQPTAAMGIVTLPQGGSRAQRQLLRELLQGSQQEFQTSQTSLVGGHTTSGLETTIGFSVIGEPWGDRLCRKGTSPEDDGSTITNSAGKLQPGDCLLLTKPLGAGVLLAAHRRAECDADWYVSLLESLLTSVERHARLAWELGARWMTDVSGFGLAVHLLELLRGQPVCAEVDLASMPVLTGSVEVSTAGITSSLFEANHQAAISRMELSAEVLDHPLLPLLFDPQTSGGLLFVLPDEAAKTFLRQSDGVSFSPVEIGRIISTSEAGRIRIVDSTRSLS